MSYLKTAILNIVLLWSSISCAAYSFCVDGIYYNIYGNNVSVTYNGSYIQNESYAGDVIIPSTVTYNGKIYSVTEIGKHAFSGCKELKSITIPTSITKIEKYAFAGCYGLETINYNAVSCDDFIMVWGDSLNVTTINVGNSVKKIPAEFANFYFRKLNNLTIGDSVTEIGKNAFGYCKSLTGVTIPNSVTEIGYGAFNECSSLKSITIPNSITKINWMVFRNCTSMMNVHIPNSVTSIGNQAFYGCSNLTSVAIPNTVTFISNDAFEKCSNLMSITVESGNQIYDSRNNCNAIIETSSNMLIRGCCNTIIPNSVTTIGAYAFNDSKGLTSIVIPNSVTKINGSAFGGCSDLESVKIGNSVTSIGDYAFQFCNLKKVICLACIPPEVFSNSFTSNTYENAVLCIPKCSLQAYMGAQGWKDFLRIVEVVDDLLGDADGDGEVGIADVVAVIDCILTSDATTFNTDNADVDQDGTISIADVVAIIDYILTRTW